MSNHRKQLLASILFLLQLFCLQNLGCAEDAPLRLVGTSFLNKKSPVAIIEFKTSGQQEIFEVGDEVFGNGSLLEIRENFIIVRERSGTIATVFQSGGRSAQIAATGAKSATHLTLKELKQLGELIIPPDEFRVNQNNADALKSLVEKYKDAPVAIARDKTGALYFGLKDRPKIMTAQGLAGSAENFQIRNTSNEAFSGLQINNLSSASALAPLGLKPGDIIVKVGGIALKNYNDINKGIVYSAGKSIGIEYLRGDERHSSELRFVDTK